MTDVGVKPKNRNRQSADRNGYSEENWPDRCKNLRLALKKGGEIKGKNHGIKEGASTQCQVRTMTNGKGSHRETEKGKVIFKLVHATRSIKKFVGEEGHGKRPPRRET